VRPLHTIPMCHIWSPCRPTESIVLLASYICCLRAAFCLLWQSSCNLVLSLTQSPFSCPHKKHLQGRLGRKCFAGVLEDAYTRETMAQYVFRRFVSEGRQAELLKLPPAFNSDLHAWLVRQACAALSPLHLWPCLSACKCMPNAH
jgi:hypothetical protein